MFILLRTVMLAGIAVFVCLASGDAWAGQRGWFNQNGGQPMFWNGFFAPPDPMFSPPRQRVQRPRQAARPKAKVARPAVKRPRNPEAVAGVTGAVQSGASAASAVTCERAQDIVAEYGFTEIEAEICTGKTYGFKAVRDGKPFSIKIVAADGEVAEVRKQQ